MSSQTAQIVLLLKRKHQYEVLYPVTIDRCYVRNSNLVLLELGCEVLHMMFVSVTTARFSEGSYYFLTRIKTGGTMMIFSKQQFGDQLAKLILEGITYWTDGEPPDVSKKIIVIQR